MRSWLFDDASLTARLKTGCTEKFRVQLLQQRYARAQFNEARLLGIPPRQRVLLREVYLYCGDVRVVYARSVVPLKTLGGKRGRLLCLGERPLGGFLFASPSIRRGPTQLANLRPGNVIYTQATRSLDSPAASLWGRRSVFRLDGKPLIVAEVFLPAINQVTRERS